MRAHHLLRTPGPPRPTSWRKVLQLSRPWFFPDPSARSPGTPAEESFGFSPQGVLVARQNRFPVSDLRNWSVHFRFPAVFRGFSLQACGAETPLNFPSFFSSPLWRRFFAGLTCVFLPSPVPIILTPKPFFSASRLQDLDSASADSVAEFEVSYLSLEDPYQPSRHSPGSWRRASSRY